jgi:predicted nucleic acid-binding protein
LTEVPHFQIEHSMIDIVLDYIGNTSEAHSTPPLSVSLPDADDNQFLEVAISANVDYLVTGNLKHFPTRLRCGVKMLSPSEFLNAMTKHRT